jgi:hypothetical protein
MTSYFGPLEDTGFGISGFDYDRFKLWIERQQLNFSKTLTIQGDLLGNWDGAIPLNLTSLDSTATSGFALDSSEGSAQFMGDIFLGGEILFKRGSSATIETNHAPQNGDSWIKISGASFNTIYSRYMSGGLSFTGGEMKATNKGFEMTTGSWIGFFSASDGSEGSPSINFSNDLDTGIYRAASNVLAISTAGGLKAWFASFGIAMVAPLTTGAAANLVQGGAAGSFNYIERSTSALKYKSKVKPAPQLANIELIPTLHYRKDDKRYRYGLIADWIAKQDPLLATFSEDGEVENYDDRAVIAVLAAKVNRLEKQVKRCRC